MFRTAVPILTPAGSAPALLDLVVTYCQLLELVLAEAVI